jgi:hypothetical protein
MNTAKQKSLPVALIVLALTGLLLVLMNGYLYLSQRFEQWRANLGQKGVGKTGRRAGTRPHGAATTLKRHARRLPPRRHFGRDSGVSSSI